MPAKQPHTVTDAHVHIERGPYNAEWIERFIDTAEKRGISELCLLEHTHRFHEFMPLYSAVRTQNEYYKEWFGKKSNSAHSLDDYKRLAELIRSRNYNIKINFGLEICYFENHEELIYSLTKDNFFDFLTGSVHYIDGFGFDHKPYLWEGIDIDYAYKRYYEIMKALIKSSLFNNAAHPDSIKCFGHLCTYDLTETYEEIAKLLIKNNMRAEQSGGLKLNYNHDELGMNPKLLSVFKKNGVRLVAASDAHKPDDAGSYIKELLVLIDED